MTRTYTIPGIVSVRITARSSATNCVAFARIDETDIMSLNRPSGSEAQAIQDVVDQLDARFARFGRPSLLD